MNTKLLLRKLANRFPKRYAKMYRDHVGLMTGKLPEEVHKIILCLDLDWEILPLIKENVPDLIITHHPFIYGTKYRVFKYDKRKEELGQGGGYTRIIKLGQRRGDASEQAIVELI